jgi:hypothetical protein
MRFENGTLYQHYCIMCASFVVVLSIVDLCVKFHSISLDRSETST